MYSFIASLDSSSLEGRGESFSEEPHEQVLYGPGSRRAHCAVSPWKRPQPAVGRQGQQKLRRPVCWRQARATRPGGAPTPGGRWGPETQGCGGTGARPGPCTATARPPGPWGLPAACARAGAGTADSQSPARPLPRCLPPREAEHRAQLPACPPPQDTEEEASLDTVPLGHGLISQREDLSGCLAVILANVAGKGASVRPEPRERPRAATGSEGPPCSADGRSAEPPQLGGHRGGDTVPRATGPWATRQRPLL